MTRSPHPLRRFRNTLRALVRFESFAVVAALVLSTTGLAARSPDEPPSSKETLDVEIVAHRGASADAPENTLAAIREAWEQGADAVEFDIRLTADGIAILCHDETAKRTTGVDRAIVDATFDELRQLDAGRWKGEAFAGERIPSLDEALAAIPAGRRALIEVKCGPEIVPELRRAIDEAGLPVEATAIISFSEEVCAACKRELPETPVYWLASLKRDPETGRWNRTVDELIAVAQRHGLDGLDLQACELIDATFVRKVREARLQVHCWTVNDPELARRMLGAGVQGITTDRPGPLRRELQNESER
ncbi:MAG TPA: glycerophosphodiester phosphodiesterase [Pirellulaceae bacterium]|nr:glycerophosphodiester phosphodiesterase [Pirellulaceae bacterium]